LVFFDGSGFGAAPPAISGSVIRLLA